MEITRYLTDEEIADSERSEEEKREIVTENADKREGNDKNEKAEKVPEKKENASSEKKTESHEEL